MTCRFDKGIFFIKMSNNSYANETPTAGWPSQQKMLVRKACSLLPKWRDTGWFAKLKFRFANILFLPWRQSQYTSLWYSTARLFAFARQSYETLRRRKNLSSAK